MPAYRFAERADGNEGAARLHSNESHTQVTVGKGVADLVLLPVEQYRRDGRVLRGLRKGTQSFLRAITIETLHTSHRVASFVARTLDDIVTQPGSHASLRGLEYYDEQPTGVLDSLEHAYDALAKEVQV